MQKIAIWEFIINKLEQNNRVKIIIVAETDGYAPGKIGAKMAVATSGEIYGTIGGGKVENDLTTLALNLPENQLNTPQLIEYNFDNKYSETSNKMICGGKQSFIIFEIEHSHLINIRQIHSIIKNHQKANISWTYTGEIVIVQNFDENQKGNVSYLSNDETWKFTETYGYEPVIHIIGGGHVSLALSKVLHTLGYYIKVYDERPNVETMNANIFADEKIVIPFHSVHNVILPSGNDYIVIMTPGHLSDEIVLRNTINLNIKYLGLMASPQKSQIIIQRLLDDGFDSKKINKLYSPIGLPINSQSPEEIAISIAAEIISINNS